MVYVVIVILIFRFGRLVFSCCGIQMNFGVGYFMVLSLYIDVFFFITGIFYENLLIQYLGCLGKEVDWYLYSELFILFNYCDFFLQCIKIGGYLYVI